MGYFEPPAWAPKLIGESHGRLLIYMVVLTYILREPPDTVSIQQFMQDESYGRTPLKDAKDPFTCGISGRTFNCEQQIERTDALARALSQELGWTVNGGNEWDKVMGVFALNTVRPISLLPRMGYHTDSSTPGRLHDPGICCASPEWNPHSC